MMRPIDVAAVPSILLTFMSDGNLLPKPFIAFGCVLVQAS